MKLIAKFLDHWWWLFYGLIPALYLSIQSAFYSYKYKFFPDFIFIYVISILFLLVAFLFCRLYAKYHDIKKGKLTILGIIFSYFTFPVLSSCVVAFFLSAEFKSLENNAIFPNLFSYFLMQFFPTVLFLCLGYYKEEKKVLKLAEFEKKQEPQSCEATEKDGIIESQRAENETLRARIAELENQLQKQSAVDSQQVSVPTKTPRTSQAQRDIFSLLVVKNFSNYPTRNSLFESINGDLKSTGINTSGISYQTLDNLIDEDLRIKTENHNGNLIEKSPFPDKSKK